MLGRRLIAFLSILFSSSLIAGAQIDFTAGTPDDLRTADVLPRTATVVKPPAGLIELLRSQQSVRISVPTSDGLLTLVGESFELFTDDAVFIEHGKNGDELVPMPRHALIRGRVEGRPGSSVFLAAFETHIVAMIEVREPEGKRRYLIAPDTIIPGRMATHIYYETRPGEGIPSTCHSESLPNYQRSVDSIFSVVRVDEARRKQDADQDQNATPYALQLALDCTLSFYTNLGSNLTTAASSAIAIAGASAVVYKRDANVILRVPYLRVWTVTDPYPGEIGAKLGKIRDHWEANMKHVQRSVTCLLSGEGGGGLAWVGVLCGSYGYNVSGVDGKVNFPASGYIWDVDVTSHELGHNIGSSHTQNCGWNPPLDSCWNAEGGCYENTRVQRGTIMSYCHLQWKGTELQFHPRVSALFNRIMANTGCVAPLPSQRDTDIAVVNIKTPANGGLVVIRQGFAPSAHVQNLGNKAITNLPVVFSVTTLANEVKKSVSATVPRIDPGATVLVSFASLSVDSAGDYLAVVTVQAPNDQHATNNIMTRPFRVGAAETGSITITSPNGGETLTAGTKAKVSFTASGVAKALFEYSIDDGAIWSTLQYSIDATTTSFDWDVPFSPSTQCRVRASSLLNAQISDVSDAMFTIVVPVDIQAYDIVVPAINTTVATPVSPRVVVKNVGNNDVTDVKARVTMRWVRSSIPTFDSTITIPRIRAGATDTVSVGTSVQLANGVHVVEFTIVAPGDINSANDRFGREFTATGITPPSDVRFEEGPGRVLLQWMVRDNSKNARIELWRGATVEELQRIRTFLPSVGSFVDDGLTNDTGYVYALRTVDGSTKSVFTPLIKTRPTVFPAGMPIVAPTLISPTDGLTNVPAPSDIVWSAVNGGDQYEVQIAIDAAFQELEYVFIVRDPGALVVPVDYNTTRRWRVRALNQTFTGPWSSMATFTTARTCAGTALTFNGTSDVASDASLTWNGGPVTVEYWTYVKRATLKTSSTFMVGTGDNGANRFQAHAPWNDGNFYWDYGNIQDKGRLTANFNPYFDQWVHVAFVSDGVNFKAIYFNGKLANSANDASQPTGLSELYIGAMKSNGWFNGSVDEFRIWNVVRTADEIQTSMFRRLPPTGDNSKIVGCWRMDEGSGTTSKDAVRNRTLMLSSATMWTPSGATVSCEDITPLLPPTFASGVGTTPLQRSNAYEVTWLPVATQRGSIWYDLEAIDPAKQTPFITVNNITASSPSVVRYALRGLPADSTMSIRIRARSAFALSPWKASTITTQLPCEAKAVRFSGTGERFTSPEFLFNGKAVTVEYWSLVNTDQLVNSVSFMVGEADNEQRRLQSHAPWSDKTLYWDYGNWREAGRVASSYENYFDKWTHVALVSNGYDSMAVYFNGSLAKRSSFTDAPGLLKQLTIGGNPYSRTYHKGTMRDLRVWNVMRTPKQITETMYERITEPRSNLLGTWLLDEGKGLQAKDASNRSANATSSTEMMLRCR
ncbi:MAG: M12 family metallo-peptidase [Candidatus Kapabacteria bacterium]|nr:M12 family metallo-peptidase [Candidatus Kapabacteria bacterium]